jgi:hypothetical protein
VEAQPHDYLLCRRKAIWDIQQLEASLLETFAAEDDGE